MLKNKVYSVQRSNLICGSGIGALSGAVAVGFDSEVVVVGGGY